MIKTISYITNPITKLKIDTQSRISLKINRLKITEPLLFLYIFLAPLGNLIRFSDTESSFGVTTVIICVVVGINLKYTISTLNKNRALYSILFLILWMSFSSIFSADLANGYTQLLSFTLYYLFSCVAYNHNWSTKSLQQLLMSFVLGALLSSSLTIIDWFGIYDIPYVNETSGGTITNIGTVMQASGPFSRRSAMAAYFSLIIPISTLSFFYLNKTNAITKLTLLSTGILCSISLMLTNNRAGLAGSICAIILISIYLSRSIKKLVRLIVIGSFSFLIMTWMVTTLFQDQLIAYQALLNLDEMAVSDVSKQTESDNIRILLFNFVIKSLISNPIGQGYTLVTGFDSSESDPHNNVAQIIWAAGIFGIGWICYFGVSFYKQANKLFFKPLFISPHAKYGIVITGGLFGWFICGMAHTIIGTGVAWLLLGILLNITSLNSYNG